MAVNALFLFAGGGGFYCGFQRNGFQAALATDIEPAAELTFRTNAPEVPFLRKDILLLTQTGLRKALKGTPVDIIVGGPPCQGFSTLGDQLISDPRNNLYEAFSRIVDWINPKCILLENTNYLRTQYNGYFEDRIFFMLEKLGYGIFSSTLNAADYGAPQIRKRLFIFGSRLSSEFSWPTTTHGEHPALQPYRTVDQAIGDLASIPPDGRIPNHVALRHSHKVILRYQHIPEGGRMPPPQLLPESIRRRNFGNTYKRLHRHRPSLTLVPGNNAFPVHPYLDRSLTPREAARLQGFPDDYIFGGNRAQQCKLVGNAVPVDLACALSSSIKSHLLDKAKRRPIAIIASRELSRLPQMSQKAELTGVSMFTGAGGLMLGFVQNGYRMVASFDKKEHIAQNVRINFPDIPHFCSDLTELSSTSLKKMVNGNVDVVFGGPPCQGFSVFGKRRFVNTRGYSLDEDERNDLSLRYLELATALNPKIIFFENVKGFASATVNNQAYLALLLGFLRRKKYDSSYLVVNCADFGVPQTRERFILIAFKKGLTFEWPRPKYFETPKSWQRPWMTVAQAISDLAEKSPDPEFSHMPMAHSEVVVRRLALIPPGGKLPEVDLPVELRSGKRSQSVKNYSHVYKRLDPNRPATTMVPGHNAFPIHPWLNRALTVREAARIQTFPDWFRFAGTRQQQCILVGNAVPPVLAGLFAQLIAKTILGNFHRDDYKTDIYELKAG